MVVIYINSAFLSCVLWNVTEESEEITMSFDIASFEASVPIKDSLELLHCMLTGDRFETQMSK